MHIRQGVAKGLGHAVMCAKPIIGDAPFAVVLPDVLMDDATADLSTENLASMMQRFEKTGFSQIMVEPVPKELVSGYGVADCGGAELTAGQSSVMTAVVEKPSIEDAPSNLAVAGRYVLPAAIWDILAKTPAGAGDEIQLTDAIATLMDSETVEAFHISGKLHDCGSKLGYMKACVEYGLRNQEFGAELKAFIKELNLD